MGNLMFAKSTLKEKRTFCFRTPVVEPTVMFAAKPHSFSSGNLDFGQVLFIFPQSHVVAEVKSLTFLDNSPPFFECEFSSWHWSDCSKSESECGSAVKKLLHAKTKAGFGNYLSEHVISIAGRSRSNATTICSVDFLRRHFRQVKCAWTVFARPLSPAWGPQPVKNSWKAGTTTQPNGLFSAYSQT